MVYHATLLNQDELNLSAIKQYRQRLVDHSVIQGEYDGYTHYHQGILWTKEDPARYKQNEIDRLLHEAETRLGRLIANKINECSLDADEVLDVGCGKCGISTIYSALNNKTNIVGIDISRYSIEYALKLPAVIKQQNRFKLFTGDYTTTVFYPNFFDIIYSVESLHYCADLQSSLAGWYSAIKDSGALVLCSMVVSGECESSIGLINRIKSKLNIAIHADEDLMSCIRNNCFKQIDVIDLTEYVSNYWILRQGWGFKSETDSDLLEAYRSGCLKYLMYVAKKTN